MSTHTRIGKQVATRDRSAKKRTPKQKFQDDVRNDSSGGSMARLAVVEAKRENDKGGIPIAEWHRKRREDEAEDLAKTRRIKAEYDEFEHQLRMSALKKR